ncbi:hypothetical protein SDC9_97512 [bioreactor metagenome]|uniref:Uncharacterized protein n=1 Tax=bioreactor metagenome TaxID=1076179 RepID=A0A645AC70_9ZZZZ
MTAAGDAGRGAGGGGDHLDDGDVVAFTCVVQDGRGGGVAGDDEHLHAALVEVVEAFQGELAHRRQRLGAVRGPGGVAEVDDVLVRQLVDDRSHHGQPAES